MTPRLDFDAGQMPYCTLPGRCAELLYIDDEPSYEACREAELAGVYGRREYVCQQHTGYLRYLAELQRSAAFVVTVRDEFLRKQIEEAMPELLASRYPEHFRDEEWTKLLCEVVTA